MFASHICSIQDSNTKFHQLILIHVKNVKILRKIILPQLLQRNAAAALPQLQARYTRNVWGFQYKG